MAKWFALVGWMLSALLLMLLVVRGVAWPFPAPSAVTTTTTAPSGVQISNSRVRGNPDAKVTLVEYADFQ